MWDDPYWEGKNLHPLAQGILIADQLGETAIRDKSISILKKILTNWFTYSGGWPDDYPYYLYYTPEWGAMQGDGGDHGMAKWMSDHHYVWGYYIYASAILGTYDKDFVNNYGGIVEHLIRDVGNPSRTDSMYPYMRAFDPYEGVSWAGGYGDSYDGNNQEATSEALYAYAGEYLWGVLTNNKAYQDAGMWVYALETNSVTQYWFNYDQDNWLPNFNHGVVSQVFGSKNYYGTYFATEPENIYGIQWLPTAPYMTYLGLRSDAANRVYNAFKTENGGIESGWYHIIWPFEALSNPQDALSKWDSNKIAADDNNGKKEWANTYWFLHAMDAFGTRSTDIWSSNWSTYQIFKKNGTYTANIWNPTEQTVYAVFRNTSGAIVGTITVPPKKTVVANPVNGIEPPTSNDQVAMPSFSPEGGTYPSVQSVVISSSTAGAIIRYTTDGSEPNPTSTKYVSPINVSQNTTLKAKAYKELMKDSDTSSATYVINASSQVAQPVITPATGNFTQAQNVSITSSTEGVSIRYTTDGSTPTTSHGNLYSATFNVTATTTVKAIAYKSSMIDSTIASSVITISESSSNLALGKTASTSTSIGGNSAAAAFDGNVTTRWESNSSDPQWIQVDLGSAYSITGVNLNWETAAGKNYKIQVSTDNITWSDAFTKTGGTGGIETNTFSSPVTGQYVRLSGTERTTGYGYSLWEFEVYGFAVTNQVIKPEFSPASGTYTSMQTVTLTSTTPDATIKYTTDGTTPTSNSATYTSPLTVSSTTTLNAIAIKNGMSDSNLASSIYTINLPSGSAVPGKIEAESYVAMNGIQVEDCSEGTKNASYIDGGDWMDYTVTVAQAGTYTVEFRLASPYNNTQLQLMNGTTILATVTAPNTGSFQTWQTVTASVTLSAGTQTLRVNCLTNGWNFNYMNFR